MKFRFNLEKVLHHRKLEENLAQKDFQEAVAKLNFEKSVLEDLEIQKKNARQFSYEKQVQGGKPAEDLKNSYEFLQGQDIRIDRQKKKIQYHEQMVEEAREILRKRAMEYKIIEKLKEKKKEQFDHEFELKLQKEADELTVTRYRRKESFE